MEDVAGAKRIHGVHGEGRCLLQAAVFVEQIVPRGPRVQPGMTGSALRSSQRLAVVGDACGLLQRLAGKHQMRGGGEQPLLQRHRAVDVDDHGNAAPARPRAEIGAEFRAAAFGEVAPQSSSSVSADGRRTFHNPGCGK